VVWRDVLPLSVSGLPRYDLAVGIHAAVSCGTGHCGSWYVTAFDGSNAVVGARTFAVCSALTGEGMAPALKSAIDQLIQQHKVVVFMKGTKQFPQCGFSNTVVQVGFKQVIHSHHCVNTSLLLYTNWTRSPIQHPFTWLARHLYCPDASSTWLHAFKDKQCSAVPC